ncbi:MAG: hypothetical protein PHR06_07705 [Candidatus Cloacimonetes bacterium]|nr:hypothetical protein [Candidatus Cloacimonadota bacterium]
MEDFDEAKDKVTLGKARKSKVITDVDKKITAVHEVGHVICSMFLDKVEPIHKVTIIPRGFTGGATHFMQTDKSYYSKSYMLQSIVGLMGGRAAEDVILKELSTGASNDIERATDLAKQMVCNWGMSEKIGPMTVSKKESQVFLGRDISHTESISEQTAQIIDSEVREIITKAYEKAIAILSGKKELLEKMADMLMEKETLEVEEIFALAQNYISEDEVNDLEKKYKAIKEIKKEFDKAAAEEEKTNSLENEEKFQTEKEITNSEENGETEIASNEEKEEK